MPTFLIGVLIVAGVLVVAALMSVLIASAIDAPWRKKWSTWRFADETRQMLRPGQWFRRPYYVDTPFICVDCGAREVWTADEQKWYFEEVKGSLYAEAKRCEKCRKLQRHLADTRRRYEELFHASERTTDQTLAMAECSLDLIEGGVFSPRHTQRIREWLNRIDAVDPGLPRVARIRERVQAIERRTDAAS